MNDLHAFDAKEQVRQATDIVDLVGRYLPLRREGRGFKALCPWHDDSKPSLQVNPQRQSFKCWVCDIGGDVFSFVMKMENVDFAEALRILAEKAGIALDRRGPRDPADDRQLLYKLLAWAEERFHRYLLDAPEAEVARRYFDDRGLTEQSLETYRLGFSPDSWDWLKNQALQAGFTEALLDKTGLIIPNEDRRGGYDRFRGRALFPIHDPQGRTIAFGGRVLPQFAEKNPAKYINSPETPLFSKQRTLYGMHGVKQILGTGPGKTSTILVMEGYTDCIMARQFGVANTVAVLGTALTEHHLKLLRQNLVERVVLVLDGDAAGQKRTNEILELFAGHSIDLRVMTLPNDLDPCDFLIERGRAAFQTLLDNAVDALEHAFAKTTLGMSTSSGTHEASRSMEHILKILAKVPNASDGASTEQTLRETKILTRMARQFDVREDVLRTRVKDLRRQLAAKPVRSHADYEAEYDASAAEPAIEWDALSTWPAREQELWELILQEPESLEAVAERLGPDELRSPAARELYRVALRLAESGRTPEFPVLFERPLGRGT
ncbi:MAG: DNA primase [Pirellulales bacterium]